MRRQSGVPPLVRDIVCLLAGAVGFGYALWSRAWEPLLISAALMAEPALLRALAGIAASGSSQPPVSSGLPVQSAPRSSERPSDDDGGEVHHVQ